VVGKQHFIGPCCHHLQGEVNGIGKKGHVYIGPECKRVLSLLVNRKQEGGSMAASDTSSQRGTHYF
jgi:hypothetical protein